MDVEERMNAIDEYVKTCGGSGCTWAKLLHMFDDHPRSGNQLHYALKKLDAQGRTFQVKGPDGAITVFSSSCYIKKAA
jgi:hypothetical protein